MVYVGGRGEARSGSPGEEGFVSLRMSQFVAPPGEQRLKNEHFALLCQATLGITSFQVLVLVVSNFSIYDVLGGRQAADCRKSAARFFRIDQDHPGTAFDAGPEIDFTAFIGTMVLTIYFLGHSQNPKLYQ